MYKYSKKLDINTRMTDNILPPTICGNITLEPWSGARSSAVCGNIVPESCLGARSSKPKKINNNYSSESKVLIDKKYVKNKQSKN